jgi:hypothetical protein
MSNKKLKKLEIVNKDPFAIRIMGTKDVTVKLFQDEKTGLVCSIRDIYPGEQLQLTHKTYKIKKGYKAEDLGNSKNGKDPMDMMDLNLAAATLEKLSIRIDRWNLTDLNGNLLPINTKNIGELQDDIYALLLKWCGEFDSELNGKDDSKN